MNNPMALNQLPDATWATPRCQWVTRPLIPRGLTTAYRRYDQAEETDDFLAFALDALQIRAGITPAGRARIPATGPLIVVANHPLGGVEGLVLLDELRRVRPDVRVLATGFLRSVPELAPWFIFVDVFGGGAAARSNTGPLRQAVRWVRQGGALLVFPAGEVSHFDWRQRQVTDPAWNENLGGLVRLTRSPVLPVFVGGINSLFFQAAGLVHPALRTALLPRELWNKRGSTIPLRVGTPVSAERLGRLEGDARITAWLRMNTYLLEDAVEGPDLPEDTMARTTVKTRPLADPVPADELAAEVAALPGIQLLAEGRNLQTWFARAEQIPRLLREIGRLRERTFRAVGEGTGRSLDLDRFDRYYGHLFVWNPDHREVVGAYRLGRTDEIVRRHGRRGLYTFTLFHYPLRFLRKMGPALELGRSFVREEYQRDYAPLLMLWKGVARYAARHPRYRTLFGPVSVSNDYRHLSRQFMVDYLEHHEMLEDLAGLVKPRRAPADERIPGHHREDGRRWLNDLDELAEWIAIIERQDRGVPVLLRQYLKMGGKLLGFNVDRSFNNALDGLILVDLTRTDPRILSRYMGAAELEVFLAYHRRDEDKRANPAVPGPVVGAET